MARRVQLRDLISDRFLREIHHLLWTDPAEAGGATDAGWSCREHALAAAFLIQSLGCQPVLLHGEVFFTRGKTRGCAGRGFRLTPHSWIAVEDVGAIDLSVKPDRNGSGNDVPLALTCVYADEWIPRGKGNLFFTRDADAFEQAVAVLPRHRNQASAVYLIKEAEQFHDGHLTHAAGWTGSPLTKKLDSIYGNPSDLYAALMMHLRAFLEGGASSLTNLSFDDAWSRLANVREGAIVRACRYLETATTLAPENPSALSENMQPV